MIHDPDCLMGATEGDTRYLLVLVSSIKSQES